MAVTIRKLGYALGAEVSGLDLTATPSDETVAELRKAWLDHVVLCFPGQHMNAQQQHAFCSRFGPVEVPNQANDISVRNDAPGIHVIVNKPIVINGTQFRAAFADEWHSDQSYPDHPGVGTFLHAVELP